ncbi:MAG TPA: hypothetical protein VKF83_11055 [Stellaceae bacterium]|nr:hypothetical protein [Stellaceae bacterium]
MLTPLSAIDPSAGDIRLRGERSDRLFRREVGPTCRVLLAVFQDPSFRVKGRLPFATAAIPEAAGTWF